MQDSYGLNWRRRSIRLGGSLALSLAVVPIPLADIHQFIRLGWSPGTCRVVRQLWRRRSLPSFQDWRDEFPLCVYLLGSHEEHGDAFNCIQEKPLIRFRKTDMKSLFVVEIHLHGLQRKA